ncbi:MAG: PAS domain S-box protein [Alphaproteobacteria bacterium]|nr:PAS domain S-box protein [Alphaproteobacteria bacterium]
MMLPPSPSNGSLALRFSLAAALLAGLSIVLVGGVFWSILVRQFESDARYALQKDTEAEAHRIGGILHAVTDVMASLSRNSLLATALVDSAGRETYLVPFLQGVHSVQGIPVGIIFTDFEGGIIATNGRASLADDERRWIVKALSNGHRQAILMEGEEGSYVLAIEMLTYDRTNTPEGALIYRLPLSAFRPLGAATRLHASAREPPGNWEALADVPVDPILTSLGLHIHTRTTPPNALQAPQGVWIGFVVAAFAAFIFVLLFSRMAGRRLTRALRDLEALANSVVREGISDRRAEVQGDDEVAALARSFNVMLERLAQAYSDLEVYGHTLLKNAEDVANVGSWRWMPDSGAMEWTDKVYEILGQSVDTHLSMETFVERAAPGERLAIKNMFRDLVQGREAAIECRLANIGRHIRLRGKPGPGPDGAPTINGTVQDITDAVDARRKLAEAHDRTEAQAARFRSLLKVASDGIHILDPGEGRLVEYSDSFIRMLGYTPEQAMTLKVTDWDVKIPPNQLLEDLHRLVDGASTVIETRHRRRDGSMFDVEINVCGIDLDNRRYLYASSRDITERKALEAALTRSNAELEQFAYIASHDLRQPLRMVTSYLSLLQQKLGNKLDDECRVFVGHAVDGARRMDALILGLLEYSRLGRANEPTVAVPLADVVAEALENLELAIADAGAAVTVADGLPVAVGNHSQLVRLFQNLIANAVKYRVPDRAPTVRIDWRDGQTEWVVGVHDNGIGIDGKDFERAFGIFQRLVSRQQYDGTGIGLAVCKKIAEYHGGRIWIESILGEGSSFLVTLPKGGN